MNHHVQKLHESLGVTPGSYAEKFFVSDHDVINRLWKDLDMTAKELGKPDIAEDYSINGIILLAGRLLPVHTGHPIFWAVKDNRAHISHSFPRLSEQDKMLVANQILVNSAARSRKDDLKSAALAVSQKGHLYIATNTQELPTMQTDKECAEVNVTRVVKQLSEANDKVARMYILGGLTDGKGKMHVDDHLIGMCMRCVEIASGIMAPGAKVTIIPANDGTATIGVRETKNAHEVKSNEAWQVPYWSLKEPSIIKFPEAVQARARQAWQQIYNGKVDVEKLLAPYAKALDAGNLMKAGLSTHASIPLLDANDNLQAVNAYMISRIVHANEKRPLGMDEVAVAVVEITSPEGKRFEAVTEVKSRYDNAVASALVTAINRAELTIPDKAYKPHISRVYLMGYNVDDSSLNYNSEQWDRLIKRVGRERVNTTEVLFLPLNQGILNENDVIRKTVKELTPTDFPGSKQHPRANGGHVSEHGRGACC